MFDDLAGKAVLITGAGSGIGLAVAKGFARCGARVAIHFNKSIERARALQAEIVESGGTAVLIEADLTKPGEARRTVEDAVRAFGGLDILVNNAGSLIRRVVLPSGHRSSMTMRLISTCGR